MKRETPQAQQTGSLQDALNEAARQLARANVDSPRLTAEVLFAHALGTSRTHLLSLSPSHPVTLSPCQSLVKRCANGEPLAYIVGHVEFYDLDLACDPRALIPRPETEQLVETILSFYSSPSTFHLPPSTFHLPPSTFLVADIGAGSGCIAAAVAKHCPAARVYATDISLEALALARQNAERNGVSGRITFLRGDLLEPLPQAVHVIAANLPYVTTPEWEALPDHIRLHEPRAALDGGVDGLDLIRRLLAQAPGHLAPGGMVALEIGASQGAAAVQLACAAFPGARVRVEQDYAGLDRLVIVETDGEA